MADDWQIIADEPGTVDNGLLTPTMKVRRGQVLERYGETIERLYEEHAARAGA